MDSETLFVHKTIKKENNRNSPLSSYEILASRASSDFNSIRFMLDDWFSRFPVDDRKDLKGRFQSSNNIDHKGAFFELIIHELHFQLECEITTHKETKNDKDTHPDFFIRDSDSETSYVETTVVAGKSNKRKAAESRLEDLIRYLNRSVESSKFWLSLERKGYPSKPVSTKEISERLNKELGLLDYKNIKRVYSEKGFEKLPKWNFDVHGCSLTFSPIPKGGLSTTKTSAKPIKIHSGEIELVDDRSRLCQVKCVNSLLQNGNNSLNKNYAGMTSGIMGSSCWTGISFSSNGSIRR